MRHRRLSLLLALALIVAFATVVSGAPRGHKKPPAAPAGLATLYANTQTSRFGAQSMTQRGIAGYYFTPKTAPAGATAQMDVPTALGLASPVPWTVQNNTGAAGAAASETVRYWGCSAKVLKGQPEVVKGAASTQGHVASGSSGYPDPMKLLGITDASHVPGDYALHVSYLGDVNLTLTDAQDFLEPLVLTAPADGAAVNTAQAIELSWNRVPRAVGYGAYASGKNAAGKTVFWSCTRNVMTWRELGVAGAVKAGALMPADHTTCTIPAGIFSGPVTLSVTAYSTDVWGKGALRIVGWAQSVATVQLGSQ